MPNIQTDPAYVGRPAADPFLNDLRNLIDIDPDARGWGAMTDAEVAEDMTTAFVYPGPPDLSKVYLVWRDERHRSNEGTDTSASSIFGRLCIVAAASVGQDVFDRSTSPPSVGRINAEQLATAKLWEAMLNRPEAWQLGDIDLTSGPVNNQLNDLRAAEVLGSNDKTALQNLSANQRNAQAHWQLERSPIEGDVIAARALTP